VLENKRATELLGKSVYCIVGIGTLNHRNIRVVAIIMGLFIIATSTG
jgi:hypothetical protein